MSVTKIDIKALKSYETTRRRYGGQISSTRRTGREALLIKLENDPDLIEVLKRDPEASLKLMLGSGFSPEGYVFRRLIAPAFQSRNEATLLSRAKSADGEKLISQRLEKLQAAKLIRDQSKDEFDEVVDNLTQYLNQYRDNRVFNWRLICRATNVYDWVQEVTDNGLNQLPIEVVIHFFRMNHFMREVEAALSASVEIFLVLKKLGCIQAKKTDFDLQPKKDIGNIIKLHLNGYSVNKLAVDKHMKELKSTSRKLKLESFKKSGYYQLMQIAYKMMPYTEAEKEAKGDWNAKLLATCHTLVFNKTTLKDSTLLVKKRVKNFSVLKGTNFLTSVLFWEERNELLTVEDKANELHKAWGMDEIQSTVRDNNPIEMRTDSDTSKTEQPSTVRSSETNSLKDKDVKSEVKKNETLNDKGKEPEKSQKVTESKRGKVNIAGLQSQMNALSERFNAALGSTLESSSGSSSASDDSESESESSDNSKGSTSEEDSDPTPKFHVTNELLPKIQEIFGKVSSDQKLSLLGLQSMGYVGDIIPQSGTDVTEFLKSMYLVGQLRSRANKNLSNFHLPGSISRSDFDVGQMAKKNGSKIEKYNTTLEYANDSDIICLNLGQGKRLFQVNKLLQ